MTEEKARSLLSADGTRLDRLSAFIRPIKGPSTGPLEVFLAYPSLPFFIAAF
ncbi:hypothetical protein PGT21_006419 [Puccinia graminis f. sp. tritici]|uniref:Uncharacterized protein n=1 Tax=Puccinia graminis f. sp. tritici TaxID=56615 RepID=A0A5B0R163_PUCGR|nr:hypothetical protein PGT21_006419 [Puccinia graminis f. sp. tritici]